MTTQTRKKASTYRLAQMTEMQISKLADQLGMSRANVIQTAVDRLYQLQETQTMNKQQAQQIMKEMEERGINDVQLLHYGPGDYSVAGQDPVEGGRFTVHTFENWENRKRDAEIDWTWRDS